MKKACFVVLVVLLVVGVAGAGDRSRTASPLLENKTLVRIGTVEMFTEAPVVTRTYGPRLGKSQTCTEIALDGVCDDTFKAGGNVGPDQCVPNTYDEYEGGADCECEGGGFASMTCTPATQKAEAIYLAPQRG